MTQDDGAVDDLLQELLWTYGPCGQEDAVRAVCARELQPVVDDMWVDEAGNLIGFVGASAQSGAGGHRGNSRGPAGPPHSSWRTWTSCPCWSSGWNRTARCT